MCWSPPPRSMWGWHLQALCDHGASYDSKIGRGAKVIPITPQRIRNLLATLRRHAQIPGSCVRGAMAWLPMAADAHHRIELQAPCSLRDSSYTVRSSGTTWYQQTFAPTWTIKHNTDGKELFEKSVGDSDRHTAWMPNRWPTR